MENFNTSLAQFIAAAQAKVDATYADSRALGLPTPKLIASYGKRYVRVVALTEHEGRTVSRSAWCFVDISNGDILKSATWQAPAKHARGSIFADDNGASAVDGYGPHYLR